ncbi:hypothetical protein ACQUQU_08000 [Thalassolituus sp. LLYu03]|uniref:hypothetical protein n=1 Tax=Thalassolituus sp. LLYu03 TaxID=3421656 RepID=UPI003D28F6C8
MNKLTLAALSQGVFTVCILCLLYGQGGSDNGGMPYEFELMERNGTVAYVKDHPNEVSFSLYGDPGLYVYSRKSGASDRVYDALKYSMGRGVRVLCDMTLGYSETPSQCFDIKIGGQVIRSYGEVQEAWASDGKAGRYLAVVMVVWSLVLFVLAYRFRRVVKPDS